MKVPRQITPEQALSRLEDLCARAEYSTGEIRRKLVQWRIPPSAAARIVESLQDGRYVDDHRFARAFVRSKVAYSRWGRRKIMAALMAKGLSRDIISGAMEEEIDEDLYDHNLCDVLLTKIRQDGLSAGNYGDRRRLLSFAASRGYEPSLVITILSDPELWEEDR